MTKIISIDEVRDSKENMTKKVTDLENEIKTILIDGKESLKDRKIELENHIEDLKKRITRIKIYDTVLILLSLCSGNIFLLISMIISSFFTSKYLTKLENRQSEDLKTYLNQKQELIDNLENEINACELYKDYLRGKNLNPIDLEKILLFLAPYFGDELLNVHEQMTSPSSKEYTGVTLDLLNKLNLSSMMTTQMIQVFSNDIKNGFTKTSSKAENVDLVFQLDELLNKNTKLNHNIFKATAEGDVKSLLNCFCDLKILQDEICSSYMDYHKVDQIDQQLLSISIKPKRNDSI